MAKFLKFIVNTVMIVAIVVAASLLVPPLAGVTTLIVDDIDMDTNLETGSVTYAWGTDAGELKVGDKILLQEDGDMLYSVSSVDGEEFILEDTLSTDHEMVTKELQGVIDKVVLTVPFLGYVSMALRTVEGLIIVGLSVVFIIILFVLSEIWRKEEEEGWEEEDTESSEKESEGESDTKETQTEAQNVDSQSEESDPAALDNGALDNVNTDNEDTDNSDVTALKLEEISVEKEDDNKNINDSIVIVNPPEETINKSIDKNAVQMLKEKVLAMPMYTKEELLERAKAAGDDPELVVDELSGVTFLDYSDVI